MSTYHASSDMTDTGFPSKRVWDVLPKFSSPLPKWEEDVAQQDNQQYGVTVSLPFGWYLK